MTIHVQFFASLRDVAGHRKTVQSLESGASVADLLSLLYASHPGLEGWDGSIRVAVGYEYVERTRKLADGDLVSIFPPVQGG